jgi:TolB-like protein/class 3 adenylate cyclase/Tfp pilus assembly protein PilF
MSDEGFERKLTAVLSADVAGYSRLMSEDDTTTVHTLKGHRKIMTSLISKYQGRVVDSPGDNLLAEFKSVLQAVNCAVEIQREMAERNEELPDDRKMEYRIGVNLGDVIEEGDRIYGDGVNIAARLESLAEPGGICISGFVYNQVKNRLRLEYEFLGEQSVKNIKEPVPVYRVLSFPGAAAHRVIEARKAAETQMVAPSFQDKPSIAVLPFVNMSDDPKQEYFSDGMAEEIIGALAKLEGLKVISRTSAFHFKGKDIDLRTIGEKLKVENVLEGSVRKAGNRLRISAQLIKVEDDTHLWSDTYDRDLKDVFAIQDEISQAVVQNLKVKLLGIKNEYLVRDYTKNTAAYELFLKGKYFENNGFFEKAIEYMEKAIEADPAYVPAYASLAGMHSIMIVTHILPPGEMKQKINSLLQKALEIDDSYALTYVSLGGIKLNEFDWQGAQKYYKRALELNPGETHCQGEYSRYLMAIGRLNEGILKAKHAVELDPLSGFYRATLGFYLVQNGQFDQAIETLQEGLELDPEHPWILGHFGLALAGKEMYDKAISILQGCRDIPIVEAYLGCIYGKSGKSKKAQKILDDFLNRSKTGYFSPYSIALVYSGLSDKDNAFEWLDKAYEVQDPCQWLIKKDRFLNSLHSDPRWTEQMKKRGLVD